MIKYIIRSAINRPISLFMVFLGIAIFGILSLLTLSEEFLPSITIPQITISTSFSSASPLEVRKLVSIPLEEALSSVTGIKQITSVSRKGTSTLVLDFEWGTDMLRAGVETREIIDNQYQSLPNQAGKPLVLPVVSNNEALAILSITPKAYSDIYILRENASKEIKTEIQQIKGVGNVTLVGGTKQEIIVEVTLPELQKTQLSIESLGTLINERNITYPVGSFIEGKKEYLVKTDAELKSLEELRVLRLPTQSQQSFLLNSIANVYFAEKEQQSFFNSNGNEAIGLLIYPQSGNHSISITKNIHKKLTTLQEQYPDYLFDIVYDASVQISQNVKGVLYSLSLGALAAFLIVLLLLRNLKIALVLIIALPFSLLITFIVLKLNNISLNLLSLSGLAISIGMLIDNSVVVLENISTKVHTNLPTHYEKSQLKEICISATHEMAKSTFGSTLTSIIVFLPLVFLPGILGKLYQDLAITISTTLIASFFVAITVVPICCLMVFKHPSHSKQAQRIPLQGAYQRTLEFFVRRPILMGTVLLLILSILAGVSLININLFPSRMDNIAIAKIQFPPNTSIPYIKKISSEASAYILAENSVHSMFSRAGGEPEDLFYWSDPFEKKENLYMNISYDSNLSFAAISDIIKSSIHSKEAIVTIEKPKDKIAMLLGLDRAGSQYTYTIQDIQKLAQTKETVQKSFPKSIFSSVNITPNDFSPELIISPNRTPLFRTGINPLSLTKVINNAIYGSYSGTITINELIYDIRIRIPASQRNNLAYINELPIVSGQGTPIGLETIANVEFQNSAQQLIRIDKNDVLIVELVPKPNISSQQTQSHTSTLYSINNSIIKQNLLYMLYILILSITLLYLFLGIQFESALDPLIVLLSIPLSLIGVILILALTRIPLTMNGILGILVLFGITVNNAIILKDTFKSSANNSTLTKDIIVSLSVARFRPILITTLTTIIALVPNAFALFSSHEQQPLAIVIIGGLLTSTLCTLFLIPVLTSLTKPNN